MSKALYAAMAKAFPEIEGAVKDSNNPHFKSKYADLSSVVEAIKPALVKNGLFFSQVNHEQQGGVCVETIVCHESGEQMTFGKLFVPASKQDAQGYGSALTYARRYSLMTAFGVCPEDDDGNAATKTAPRRDAPAPEPIKRAKLDGPYPSKTALWNAVKQFDREVRSCGDGDQFDALLATDETNALLNQVRRDAPQLMEGGIDLPAEFEPLNSLLLRVRNELTAADNNSWQRNPLAAG